MSKIYQVNVSVEAVTDPETVGEKFEVLRDSYNGPFDTEAEALKLANALEPTSIANQMRRALADLHGIMPEHEPDGDRAHPGWQTIAELREYIAVLEGGRKVFDDYPDDDLDEADDLGLAAACTICGEKVEEDDPYFSTYCGTYCSRHGREHVRQCVVCGSDSGDEDDDDGE